MASVLRVGSRRTVPAFSKGRKREEPLTTLELTETELKALEHVLDTVACGSKRRNVMDNISAWDKGKVNTLRSRVARALRGVEDETR